MGTLKQLLPYRGQTLAAHAVKQARQAGFNPVVLVVGAEAVAVRAAIEGEPVSVVENCEWARGMGSSLVAGMRFLVETQPDLAAAAILLADQPLVTSQQLAEMRALLFSGSATAIAAQYDATLGVPAIFKSDLFSLLLTVPADAGARHILRERGITITAFPLPEAAVDLDTPEDFAALDATRAKQDA